MLIYLCIDHGCFVLYQHSCSRDCKTSKPKLFNGVSLPFSFTPVSIAHPSRDRALSQQQFISFYQTSQTKAHSPLPSNSSITIQRAHLRGQGLSSSHSAFLLASNSESLQPHPSREWLFPAVTTFKRLGPISTPSLGWEARPPWLGTHFVTRKAGLSELPKMGTQYPSRV